MDNFNEEYLSNVVDDYVNFLTNYCSSQSDCLSCHYFNEELLCCRISDIPADWIIK